MRNKPSNGANFYFVKKKWQQSAVLANPATPDPKDIRIDYSKNREYEPRNIITEYLSVEVTALKLFVKEQLYIVKKLLKEFVNCKHPRNNSLYINSPREEIEYLREENQAMTLIMKQLTDTKTKMYVNPTSMLVAVTLS